MAGHTLLLAKHIFVAATVIFEAARLLLVTLNCVSEQHLCVRSAAECEELTYMCVRVRLNLQNIFKWRTNLI